jgi:hypothetical protein
MKTERVTLLTSPQFKQYLTDEARREGVSVAELVRSRCEGRKGTDELLLAQLSEQLLAAVRQAKTALKRGLDEANAALADLRGGQTDEAPRAASAARRARKRAGARA